MKRISFDCLFYKVGILPTVLFLCLMINTKAIAQQEIIWETNLEQAFAQAKLSNRPLFLHFYGDDCPPCKLMESSVFNDRQVVSQMNRFFVPVKIKVSEQTQAAKKYSVQVIPTDLVLTRDGRLIHRRQGGITTERFLEYFHFLLSNINQPVSQPLNRETVQQVSTPVQTVPEPKNSAPISPLQFQSPPAQIPVSPQPAESANYQTEQPKIEITQNEPPKIEQVLRDPFTRQPVISPPPPAPINPPPPSAPINPTPVNPPPPEQINPVRITEKRTPHEEKTALFKTVDTIFTPQIHKEPATVPAVSSAGVQSNDEMTTTMVEVPLGLEGYCPVLLSTEERWVPGNPAYYTMYRGHVFRFSSEEAMTEFMKTPALYAPVAMGEDIVLMVDRNKKIYGNRKYGAWFQGRVFLFCNQESLDSFAARPEYYAEIALKYEVALKGNSGRFF
jgi:YHS domain-containing protein/thioredoxin-related protein